MLAIAPLLFWAWLNNESPMEKETVVEDSKEKTHVSGQKNIKKARKKLTKEKALEILCELGFSELPQLRFPTLIISVQQKPNSGFQGINFLDGKKPILLHFWALWCGPCKRELPAFAEFVNSQDIIDAYTFSSELRSADPSVAQKSWNYYNNNGINGLNVCADIDGNLTSLLSVSGIPVTFLISADGILLGRFLGAADWANPMLTDALIAYVG